MQENLTQEALVRCFQEKERYKGTSAFIAEVNKYNQAIYPSINGGLTHTLLGNSPNYISKLFALRFFKEVLLTGNFSLIDQLDEEIEDHLIAVAQYNRKSKELNRGANYFIEIEKLKKDAEIQRIGSSYVLLAIEIIAVFSRWYAVDDEGKQSRFAEYAKELIKNGVGMPAVGQYNFFKKEEQKKFKKNYNKWLQWYAKNMNQEDKKTQGKEKNVEKKQIEAAMPTILEEVKQENSLLQALDLKEKDLVSKIVLSNSKKEKVAQNTPIFATFRQDQKIKGQTHNLDKNAATGNSLNIVVNFETAVVNPSSEQENITKNKQQAEKIGKQKPDQKSNNEKQFIRITKENAQKAKRIQQLLKIIAEKDVFINKLEEQTKKHEEELKKKNNQLEILTTQKQQLSEKMNQISNKPVQSLKQSQCYKIMISPPLQLDEVIDQNEMLKQTIQILQESNKKTEESLKGQNIKLLSLLRDKQAEIQNLKSQPSNIENEIIKNLIHQDSLIISDQVKIQKLVPLPVNVNVQNTPLEEKRESLLKNCSVSQYLRNQYREVNENQPPRFEDKSRSLKKTESLRKMKKVYETDKGVSQTGADFYRSPAATQKLHKTVHSFNKSPYEGSSKFTTIYPFLEDYFPKLPAGCPKFKSHCLQLLDSSKPYFQNEYIKVALKVVSPQKFIIGIQNRTNQDQKVKLVSGHYSIAIQGEKVKKIPSLAAVEFDIRAVNIDLNLRYPIVSVLVGNHGISLTNSNSNDKVFHIPLPITLLNYCAFKNSRSAELSSVRVEYKKLKYMSDRFVLSGSFSNIRDCFPLLSFSYQEKESVYRGIVDCQLFQDAKVLLQMKENNRQLTLCVEFEAISSRSSDLGKVLLQVLAFLLKD